MGGHIIVFFSGSNQGIKNDNVPTHTPFSSCNLGASLIQNGHSFAGYAEGLPSEGYLGYQSGRYYRRHNPWSNWQGGGSNQIPPSSNKPFDKFPDDFNLLPEVSMVVPDIVNCMHDGTLRQGDDWLKHNLSDYISWCNQHNSIFILTFDEDGGNGGNRILTLIYGSSVTPGYYEQSYNHYNLLRTIEDMFHLQPCSGSVWSS